MGIFEVPVRILSPDGSAQVELSMLVDTGSTFSLVPASTLRQLGIHEQVTVPVEYATGQGSSLPMGIAMMEIDGFAGRLPMLVLFGDDSVRPLLGAHALEAFRLSVDPIRKVLSAGPALLM